MSEVAREVTPRVFDDLAIRVGIEFDDCSIAASAAYHSASSMFEESVVQKIATFYNANEPAEPGHKYQVVDLDTDLRLNDGSANLILMQPVAETRVKERTGFLRRAVTFTQFTKDGDPILAAQVGEDVIIPLASFAHREESRYCSYVQLGSEMTDDSVVMTGLDAGTPRHDVVEAIRLAIDRPWSKFSEDSEWYAQFGDETNKEFENAQTSRIFATGTLQSLFEQQISQHGEAVRDTKAALLVRLCAEKLGASSLTQQLSILSESDSSTFEQAMRVFPLLKNVRYEDGRKVDLVLARAGNKADQMRILAVTRGDIALPVATLIPGDDILVFENKQWNMPGTRREEAVDSLLARVRGESILVNPQWETPEGYKLRGSRGYGTHVHSSDLVAANYCYELGLLREDEGAASYRQDGVSFTKEALLRCRRAVESFFSDPEVMELPSLYFEDGSPPIELALARLPQLRKAQRAILGTMDIVEQITDKLGECTLEEEILAQRLHTMSQHATEFRAIAKNRDTGKTRADIALAATLSKQASIYDIRIAARPSTMSNEEFKLFLQYTFDMTQPLFDRNKNTQQQIAAKAKELAELLKILSAS